MNDHSIGGCGEGTDDIRRLVSILFGDLLVGCDSNKKWSRRANSCLTLGTAIRTLSVSFSALSGAEELIKFSRPAIVVP